MTSNRTEQLFLEKRFGVALTPVVVDEGEYGMLGEQVDIESLHGEHQHPTHYQTPLLSEQALARVQERLVRFGCKPESLKAVPQGAHHVLLIEPKALEALQDNHLFLRSTAHNPLLRDTGVTQITS